MLFLIQSHRRAGKLVRLERFATSQRAEASQARLDLEIELRHRGLNHEVVILEAASEEVLRKTHGRYFLGMRELLEDFARSLQQYAPPTDGGDRPRVAVCGLPTTAPGAGTKLQATASGIVKRVCGVGLRSRPHVDRQPCSQADLRTHVGPMCKQLTPQTLFARTRPTHGTSPRRRRKDNCQKHILVAAKRPGWQDKAFLHSRPSPISTNRQSPYGRSP